MTDMKLLVAFTDDSPSFAYGFEAGQIFEALQANTTDFTREIAHRANREVIARMCATFGWAAEFEETAAEWDRGCRRLRSPPAPSFVPFLASPGRSRRIAIRNSLYIVPSVPIFSARHSI